MMALDGSDAAALGEGQDGATHALWTSFGDAYATAGRQARNVAAAIVGAGPIVSGRQMCLAALVDLKTGDIVWFARRAVTGGNVADLRTAEGARAAVRDLFEDLRR